MKKIATAPHFQRPVRIEDGFFSQARKLRSLYEHRFADPLRASSDRFCWDYWFVPDQYRLLRTPAQNFFGEKAFQPFLRHLLAWGRRHLGCQMISHPWLSVYLDGSHQALHSDVPHGPWSFVYSLTPWATREFKGGETLISRPKLLRYFREVRHDRSDEADAFFEKIEPRMNRLTVFDPRYPHGVARVSGAEDLLKARVVIHGWFTEPRPMIEGSLSAAKVSRPLDAFAYSLIDRLRQDPRSADSTGLLTLRFRVLPSGKIGNTTLLCGHLVDSGGDLLSASVLKQCVRDIEVGFPKSRGSTEVTLPIELKG